MVQILLDGADFMIYVSDEKAPSALKQIRYNSTFILFIGHKTKDSSIFSPSNDIHMQMSI